MKNIIFFLVLLAGINYSCRTNNQNKTQVKDFKTAKIDSVYKWMQNYILEKHLIDLDYDNKLDTIIIKGLCNSTDSLYEIGDLGVFSRYIINFGNGKTYELDKSFDYIDTLITKRFVKLLPSNLFYLINFNEINYIFLNGPKYGCCIEDFWIITISQYDLSSQRIQLRVNDIVDLNSDSIIDIIGYESYTSKLESYTEYRLIDYVPFKVYSKIDSFVHNTILSDDYNIRLSERFGNFDDSVGQILVITPNTDSLVYYSSEAIYKYAIQYQVYSTKKMESYDISWRKKEEIEEIKNELLAKHGFIFSSKPELMRYYEKTMWYTPLSTDVSSKLNEFEKYNIKFIDEYLKNLTP